MFFISVVILKTKLLKIHILIITVKMFLFLSLYSKYIRIASYDLAFKHSSFQYDTKSLYFTTHSALFVYFEFYMIQKCTVLHRMSLQYKIF